MENRLNNKLVVDFDKRVGILSKSSSGTTVFLTNAPGRGGFTNSLYMKGRVSTTYKCYYFDRDDEGKYTEID